MAESMKAYAIDRAHNGTIELRELEIKFTPKQITVSRWNGFHLATVARTGRYSSTGVHEGILPYRAGRTPQEARDRYREYATAELQEYERCALAWREAIAAIDAATTAANGGPADPSIEP